VCAQSSGVSHLRIGSPRRVFYSALCALGRREAAYAERTRTRRVCVCVCVCVHALVWIKLLPRKKKNRRLNSVRTAAMAGAAAPRLLAGAATLVLLALVTLALHWERPAARDEDGARHRRDGKGVAVCCFRSCTPTLTPTPCPLAQMTAGARVRPTMDSLFGTR
jgi:hypothetical protein